MFHEEAHMVLSRGFKALGDIPPERTDFLRWAKLLKVPYETGLLPTASEIHAFQGKDVINP